MLYTIFQHKVPITECNKMGMIVKVKVKVAQIHQTSIKLQIFKR